MNSMKKNFKLVLALVLSLLLVASSVAFAENPTVTIGSTAKSGIPSTGNTKADLSSHMFTAYQVLSANYTNNKYVDIAWGANIKSGSVDQVSALLTALKADATIGSDFTNHVTTTPGEGQTAFTAISFADVIKGYANDSNKAVALSRVLSEVVDGTGISISGSSAVSLTSGVGYYVIKDVSTASEVDAINPIVLFAAPGSTEITVKTEFPTIDKKILHDDKTGNDKWDVDGDDQIGDWVWFKIETSVPNTSEYNKYTYEIQDTLSKGLELDLTSIKTFTSEQTVTKATDPTALTGNLTSTDGVTYPSSVTGSSNADAGTTFKIGVTFKTYDSSTKTSTETAAYKTGTTKNTKLYTYYRAKLTKDAKLFTAGQQNKAKLVYDNNPYGDGKGETEDTTVYEWTFNDNVKKTIDTGAGTQLAGAKFAMAYGTGADQLTGITSYDADTDTVTPASGVTVLKFLKTTDSASNTDIYTVVPADTEGAVSTITSVAGDKKIKVQGLNDDVDYYLHEVVTPDGYSALTSTIHVKVAAAYNASNAAEAPTLTYTGDGLSNIEEGGKVVSATATIVNKSGSTLPETGGIGTTLFYVGGSILVLAAAILLITKRRMSSND